MHLCVTRMYIGAHKTTTFKNNDVTSNNPTSQNIMHTHIVLLCSQPNHSTLCDYERLITGKASNVAIIMC